MATKESFFESYDCFCSPKDVFLGPISEYVLAPVARFSSIWKVPILTTGGQGIRKKMKAIHRALLTSTAGTDVTEFSKKILERNKLIDFTPKI